MDIDAAKKHRRLLKSRLTKTETAISSIQCMELNVSLLEKVKSLRCQTKVIWDEYYELQSRIIEHISEDQSPTETSDLHRIEEQYLRIDSTCRELLSGFSSSSTSVASVRTTRTQRSHTSAVSASLNATKSEGIIGRIMNRFKSKEKPVTTQALSHAPSFQSVASRNINDFDLETVVEHKSRSTHPEDMANDYEPLQVSPQLPVRKTFGLSNFNKYAFPEKSPPKRSTTQSWYAPVSSDNAQPYRMINPFKSTNFVPTQFIPSNVQQPNVPLMSSIQSHPTQTATVTNPMNSDTATTSTNTDIQTLIQALASNFSMHSMVPQMQPLKFSGKPSDWQTFRDLFQSLASRLHTDADRLLHLKLCCKDGTAERLVSYYDTTNESYPLAWQALEQEYDQEKSTIVSHIKKLINQKSVVENSATSLRSFYTEIDTVLRSLKAIKYEQRDLWLITILLDKLDQRTAQSWGLYSAQIKLPQLEDFLKFLSNRCNALDMSSTNDKQSRQAPKIKTHHAKTSSKSSTNDNKIICIKCKQDHWITRCPKFQEMQPKQRLEWAKQNSLCLNCLRKHSESQCQSRFTCRSCQKSHHSLLHDAFSQPETIPVSHVASLNDVLNTGILPTAWVNIVDAHNNIHSRRIMIDCGSNSSLITESLAQHLKLSRTSNRLSVGGAGDVVTCKTRGLITVTIKSRFDDTKCITVQASILKKVTGVLPQQPYDTTDWEHLHSLQLADPYYMKPDNVDMIIGVQNFVTILEPGLLKGPEGKPDAVNSIFGWLIMGDTGKQGNIMSANAIVSLHTDVQLDIVLRKFWEVEQVPSISALTDDEIAAETHFKENTTRSSDGRFKVKLPFKSDSKPLGNSFRSAFAQAINEEKRRIQDPVYNKLFHEFMQDINNRHHWKEIAHHQLKIPDNECYYMKRHGILKEASTTTKLRVVVNASSATSNGISLNDNLLIGPKVQRDQLDIMIRFRLHRFVFIADIEKMYRMINMDEQDSDFQRILYRSSPSEQFRHYRLSTVIYGTRSAPFLATRALKECAELYRNEFPEAAEVLLNDCYVDDITSGHESLDDCIKIIKNLKEMLLRCGFHLRKWSFNDSRLMSAVPENEIEVNLLELQADCNPELKVLGVWYDPRADVFRYKVNICPAPQATRRTLLSEIARVYDPFGLIQPVIIASKITLQEVWIIGTGWDDVVPQEISKRWSDICNEFQLLDQITVPRLIPNHSNTIELFGFCDASERSYCAVVYARHFESSDINQINIVVAKTKVAPIKPMSVARLELCSALLLSTLMSYLKSCFSKMSVTVRAFSDSKIVLAWLTQDPRKWKTFVAQRVAAITEVLPPEIWNHVATEHNPADKGTRGMLPSELLTCDIWWHGPDWLRMNESDWPCSKSTDPASAMNEARPQKIESNLVTTQKPNYILQAILNITTQYHKMVLIAANIQRAAMNFKSKNRQLYDTSPITIDEYDDAELLLIKLTQQSAFHEEISALKQNKELKTSNRITKLHPFIDAIGLLRVGGRLLNSSSATYDMKHPIIVPWNHPVIRRMATYLHMQHFHASNKLLSNIINQRFWVIGIRNLARVTCFECKKCYILKANATQQLQGNLPACRIEQNPVFQHVGVDLAGPILIRMNRLKKSVELKAYIVLFICMVSKAVHLELAEDLSTEGFLAAFECFVATRGYPTDIYSDNGTNFVGANRELQNRVEELTNTKQLKSYLLQKRIIWHFNSPRAPHQGGLWESNIKSLKKHLKATIGEHKLTIREMMTLLKSIEACLNSRPLCDNSTDPDNYDVLTPGHFIINRPLVSIPQRNYDNLKLNRLKAHQLITRLSNEVWQRWKTEYLWTLQPRTKHLKIELNLQVNDLVVLTDEHTPPTIWPLGRIIEVYPDAKGQVRNVDVKTINGIFRRAVQRLIKLPKRDEDNFEVNTSTGAGNGCA